ncbi:MAG: hypothetical protein ACTJH9_14580 [Pseudoalteromonas sp.]
MNTSRPLSKPQRIIKHILLWTVFSYCFHSAINLLVKMALDAEPDNALLTAIIYCLGFNVLTAHLITKYDKHFPVIAALFIACVGLIVVPLIFVGAAALLASELIAVICISLPLLTLLVAFLKRRAEKNSPEKR